MTKKLAVFAATVLLLFLVFKDQVKAEEDRICEIVFPGGNQAAPGENVAVHIGFLQGFGFRPIQWVLHIYPEGIVDWQTGTVAPWWGGIDTSITIPYGTASQTLTLRAGGTHENCSKELLVIASDSPLQHSTTTNPCGTPTGNSDFDACNNCMKADNTWTALGCVKTNNMASFIAWILAWALGIGGGIALVISIFGGFQIITSAGNPEKVKAGKDLITAALSGLLFIAFSIFLLELIGVKIFHLPGFLK